MPPKIKRDFIKKPLGMISAYDSTNLPPGYFKYIQNMQPDTRIEGTLEISNLRTRKGSIRFPPVPPGFKITGVGLYFPDVDQFNLLCIADGILQETDGVSWKQIYSTLESKISTRAQVLQFRDVALINDGTNELLVYYKDVFLASPETRVYFSGIPSPKIYYLIDSFEDAADWTVHSVSSGYVPPVIPPTPGTYTVGINIINPIGGSVTPGSGSVASGGSLTFTVTTNIGYTASISEGYIAGGTWVISGVTSNHTATLTFTATVTPPTGTIPLAWGLNPLNPAAWPTWAVGQTRTYDLTINAQATRLIFIYTPQSLGRITATYLISPKPDGSNYTITPGYLSPTITVSYDANGTHIGLPGEIWAEYDGAIGFNQLASDLFVTDNYFYIGHLYVTMTQSIAAGYGSLTTSITY